MTYNEKGNLSGLLRATDTSGMLLSTIREVILSSARMVNFSIIDPTGDQKWPRVGVHGVDLEHYSRDPKDMELMQWEIQAGANYVTLA